MHADQFDEVVSGLVDAAGKARIGPGLDPGTQIGPLISAEQEERVRGYIEKGKEEGAELVTGGGAPQGRRLLRRAHLFSATSDDLTIAREEIFDQCWWLSPTTRSRRWRGVPTTPSTGSPPASGPPTSRRHKLAELPGAGDIWVNT